MSDEPITRRDLNRASAVFNTRLFQPLADAYLASKASPTNRTRAIRALREVIKLCKAFQVDEEWHRTLVELGRLDDLALSPVKIAMQRRSATPAMKSEAQSLGAISGHLSAEERRWLNFCRVLMAIEEQRQTHGRVRLEDAFQTAADSSFGTFAAMKADYHTERSKAQAEGAKRIKFTMAGKRWVVQIPTRK